MPMIKRVKILDYMRLSIITCCLLSYQIRIVSDLRDVKHQWNYTRYGREMDSIFCCPFGHEGTVQKQFQPLSRT